MYAQPIAANPLPAFVIPLIAILGGATATIVSAKIMAGASTPKQEEIEKQIRLQHQLELERRAMEQQQTQQTASFLMPVVGVLALIMLLR